MQNKECPTNLEQQLDGVGFLQHLLVLPAVEVVGEAVRAGGEYVAEVAGEGGLEPRPVRLLAAEVVHRHPSLGCGGRSRS